MAILEIYRGYTITDEPNGGYPFSIYDEERSLLMDADSDTIEQARKQVDIVADERQAEQDEKERLELEEEIRSRYSSSWAMWKDFHPGYY